MKKKSTIAVDIGGTIEDSWSSKRNWFVSRGFNIGKWPTGRREIVRFLGGQESLYEEMVAEVYNDESILTRKLIKGSFDALKIMAPHFRIVLLSSRAELNHNITVEWMKNQKIFDFIDEIIFLGDKGNKLEFCVNAGVRFFVDDDIRHLESIEGGNAITRIHFCQRPRGKILMSFNIFSAANWQEVMRIIQTMALKP